MASPFPLVDELKASFQQAQAHLAALDRGHVPFWLRLEFRLFPNGDDHVIGIAERHLESPALPRAGEYLCHVGPWGERPLVDRIRIVRIEHSPVPKWGDSRSRMSIVTVAATGYTYGRDRVESELSRNGWITSFVTSAD